MGVAFDGVFFAPLVRRENSGEDSSVVHRTTLRVGQVSGCQTFAFFKLLETNRLKPSNIQLGATDSSTVRRNFLNFGNFLNFLGVYQ